MHTLNPQSESLYALFDTEWDYDLQQDPLWASVLGDRRWNRQWPNLSLDAIESRGTHYRQVLEKLEKMDLSALSEEDRLNHALFLDRYRLRVEEHGYRWYLIPLNQREGVQTADELTETLRFETPQDFEDWTARLEALPDFVNQTIGLLSEGIRAGMVQPRVVMERVPQQIEKQIVSDPEASGFYRPFREGAGTPCARDAARLIGSHVIPAYRRFQRFFLEEYLPACREEAGCWSLPNGEALYRYFVRCYTTTDLSPEEIHAIGVEQVARIRAEMERVRERVGFTGSLAEFFQFLRTDPQFFYSSGEELLNAYRAMSKRIDPELVKVLRTLPRMPYGVEPIPDAAAPDTTTAYYMPAADDGSRAGRYYVNLYRPETRPKWEMMALSLHEAVPGHHLQIALAQELHHLPHFRRHGFITAYLEGWALYAESLGIEMGLYDDPYAWFGRLTYDMWRAVRLVVDTGIHALRWDRRRAIDYFMENAAKTELDVVNEIDRYIAWPGQALAYKIGELRIQEIRRRAEEALGAAFDLRDFNDALLRDGALPLNILEQKMARWAQDWRQAAD